MESTDGLVKIVTRCRACRMMGVAHLRQPLKSSDFPRPCESCTAMRVLPLQDGELANMGTAFEANVLLARE